MDTDALTHHGVKGMKWGVRKQRETSGNSKKNRTFGRLDPDRIRRAQELKSKLSRPERKDVTGLTDQELKKVIERLKMNTEYARLTQSSIERGANRLQKVMSTSLLGLIGSVVTRHMQKKIDRAIG